MAKLSLAEILGSKGAQASSSGRKLSFDDLGELIGEGLPEIPFDSVGRYRLVTALRTRFGESYRNVRAVKDILEDFDSRREFEDRITQMKGIKYSPKKKGEG